MREASFLVFPSKVYEGFPMTLLEALATGLPAIASGHGSIAEVVKDGVTGRHFRPGDHRDLAAKVAWASANPGELAAMGGRGRDEYLSQYTSEQSYLKLAAVYQTARARTTPGATTSTPRRIFSNAAARSRWALSRIVPETALSEDRRGRPEPQTDLERPSAPLQNRFDRRGQLTTERMSVNHIVGVRARPELPCSW